MNPPTTSPAMAPDTTVAFGPARPDPVPCGGPSSFLVRAARGGFNRSMGDKTIIKVDSTHSPHGPLGQLYLATGSAWGCGCGATGLRGRRCRRSHGITRRWAM